MKKNSQMIYKRDKGKIEISGEPEEVRLPMWFDLISTRLVWIILIVVLLFTIPKLSWIPIVLQWLKKSLPLLIFFVGLVGYLSG